MIHKSKILKNYKTFWLPNLDKPNLFQDFASDWAEFSEITINRNDRIRHLPAQS